MGKKSKKSGKSSVQSSPRKITNAVEDSIESEGEKPEVVPLQYKKPNTLTRSESGISSRIMSPSRKASGVYSQLTKQQIDILRDVFSLIDEDSDGIISNEDLKHAYKLINKQVKDDYIESMFDNAQDPLTFGGFLSLLADSMSDLSSKDELESAFEVFKIKGDGEMKCNYDELSDSLILSGMKKEDIDGILKSFIKSGMDGSNAILAQRFINTLRDD